MRAALTRNASVLLLAALGVWTLGCSEDPVTGAGSTLVGTVTDLERAAIYDVQVAVVYSTELLSASAAPGPVSAAADEIRLLAPYPNPSYGIEGVPVTLRVEAPAETTGRLEIWSQVFGPLARIKQIYSGALPGPGTWTWNHTEDSGETVPNGLYTVRLTLPAEGAAARVLESPVLLNRPAVTILRRSEYNAFTDPRGEFILENLPVGVLLTLTASDGRVLGPGGVRSRADLLFRAQDYRDYLLTVNLPPGGSQDIRVLMEPLFPSGRTDRDPVPKGAFDGME